MSRTKYRPIIDLMLTDPTKPLLIQATGRSVDSAVAALRMGLKRAIQQAGAADKITIIVAPQLAPDNQPTGLIELRLTRTKTDLRFSVLGHPELDPGLDTQLLATASPDQSTTEADNGSDQHVPRSMEHPES